MKELILSALAPGDPWGNLLQYYPCVESTNTLAKAQALQGIPHGTVIIAGSQTGGRGRMGRSFHSPAGTGLYLSAIVRPQCTAGELMHLTCAAAVAVREAIAESCRVETDIKWINDLVCDRRKIAGILTELSLVPGSDRVAFAVIGVGINCLQQPQDFPPELQSMAGSLRSVSGREVSPAAVAAAVIAHLRQMDAQLLSHKQQWMARYRSRCITLGREVSIHRGDTVSHATAVDVDPDGGLAVVFPDGSTQTVNSGEASIRGMYGYV